MNALGDFRTVGESWEQTHVVCLKLYTTVLISRYLLSGSNTIVQYSCCICSTISHTFSSHAIVMSAWPTWPW